MKMYKIIIGMILIFGGCTINMTPPQPQQQVEKKVEVVKKHKPWPHDQKIYWYARYFHIMASMPAIQKILKPDQLFEVVKCAVNQYEKDHDWKWFQENLGNQITITPENNRYVYIVTKRCADFEKSKIARKPQSIEI
jgi:hypothetical protein